ncbi:MAG: sigma-70 family RNA polymerase sigma factor [Sandaracinaceae bacterium]
MSRAEDDAFVKEHEPLVRKLALRVRAQLDLTTEVEELMAYGFEGLLEARGRFDPERGAQFTTFAYYRVRGAILDGVRQMAYLPRRIHAARKAAETLDRESEGVAETRATYGSDVAKVAAARAAQRIEDILTRTCAAYQISVVGQDVEPERPEESLIRAEERARVHEALKVLDDRERTLVVGYFFEDRTLDEMGKEMGISKSWASRVCSRALSRLRKVLESTG